MDQTRLDAIRARCEAATVAPWKLSIDGDSIINESGQTVVGAFWHDGPLLELPDRNAEFIAAARTDVPDLLAEIERLTAEADTWRRMAERLESRLASMTAERDALIASLRNNDKCETCMHSLSDGCSAIRNGWRCRYVHPSEEWRGPEEDKS